MRVLCSLISEIDLILLKHIYKNQLLTGFIETSKKILDIYRTFRIFP